MPHVDGFSAHCEVPLGDAVLPIGLVQNIRPSYHTRPSSSYFLARNRIASASPSCPLFHTQRRILFSNVPLRECGLANAVPVQVSQSLLCQISADRNAPAIKEIMTDQSLGISRLDR